MDLYISGDSVMCNTQSFGRVLYSMINLSVVNFTFRTHNPKEEGKMSLPYMIIGGNSERRIVFVLSLINIWNKCYENCHLIKNLILDMLQKLSTKKHLVIPKDGIKTHKSHAWDDRGFPSLFFAVWASYTTIIAKNAENDRYQSPQGHI